MAITKVQKVVNKSSTNASSYATASLTATANKLYVIIVMLYGSGSTPTASVTGGGLGTWTKKAGAEATNASNVCASIHHALSSSPGAAAAVTITASGACTGAAWEITEFDGMPTTGTQGADAVGSVANNKGSATSGTVTLASVASDSAVYATFSIDSPEAMNPGGSYAETTEQQAATEGDTMEGIYLNPGTTTPNTAWTSSVTWAGAAMEIKIASAGTTRPVKMAGNWGGYAGRSGGFVGRSRHGLHIPSRFGDMRMAA